MAQRKIRRLRLRPVARGLRMRSRDRLIRLRETRLKQMGVNRYRYLAVVPVLLALIVLVGWLRTPRVTEAYYQPNEETFLTPLAGWAVCAQSWGAEEIPDVSLVYAEVTWKELETAPGEYDFAAFEEKNHLNEWWAEGKRLILRFVMDVPGEKGHMDIPDWLYEDIDGAGSFYETSQGAGFSPDYSDILLRERHRQVILALAERYDQHPGVAYVEIGSLGRRGEWTVELGEEGVEALPMSSIAREYAWHYTSAFQNTLMLMRRPYKETQLMQVGVYNAELGDEEATWQWLDDIEGGGYDHQIETGLMAMPDFYMISPAGAHIPAQADLETLLTTEYEALWRQITESHLSYAVLEGDLTALSEEAMQALRSLDWEIGYRLWVRGAEWDSFLRPGVRCKVLLKMRNDGGAPLIADWPVALALFDGDEMVACQETELGTASFLPGDTDWQTAIDIPDQMPAGEYTLKLAILDPEDGKPGVRLCMDECDENTLWTALGTITVRP